MVAPAISAGTRLGHYAIVDLLGRGGMGEVYRARDPRLGRDVALKVLPAEVAGDPQRLARFEREARAVAALNHPNILTVHDVGSSDGTAYLVTELLEGQSLVELMCGPTPSVRRALGLARQAASGLEAAHARGIVHRDIKPGNLFITSDGRLKILDFGIAKLTGAERAATLDSAIETADATAAGTLTGTLSYMSPEQARGEPVDARTDLFSLGVVLYELLSGRHPFRRASPAGTLEAILHDAPELLSRVTTGVPAAVASVVERCLAKDREERLATAHDLAVVLEAILGAPEGDAPSEPAVERNPFPGLEAFTERDAKLFFGRGAEIAALWDKLRQRRLLAVIGASGAGKTSFVRAGVVAHRPEGWGALVARPGRSPLLGLGRALAPELAGDPDAVESLLRFDEPDVVVEAFARWRHGHREALLVVDQLEELFTLSPVEVQEGYAALLARLADEADLHVLLSLRDDFLMRCHEHPPLAPVFESLTPLGTLGDEGLRAALVEPARSRGYEFEDPALPDEMVEAVKGERGALPLLAFAAARLWESRDREGQRLTREAYAEIGGVSGALARHAEATLQRVGTERQGMVREMFRNLVTSQGTRAACDREELLSVFEDRAAAADVLRELVDARLLTSYELPTDGEMAPHHRVEVVHESLLAEWPRLVRWRAQDEEGAVLRDQLRQAAHVWEERGRPADLLWSGTSYRELELWRERYPGHLTALEEAFAQATSTRARRLRRLRGAAGLIVVAASLAVAAAVSISREEALRSADRAQAARVVALSRVQLASDPTAALAYVRKSLEIADTPEARRMAVDALWRGAGVRILPLEYVAWRAAFSPDGSRLVAPTFSENLLLVSEIGASQLLAGFTSATSIQQLAFTPSGERLLTRVPQDEDALRLVSLPDGETLRWLRPEPPGGAAATHWHHLPVPEGVLFATWNADAKEHHLGLRPYDGGAFRTLGLLQGAVADLALGPSRLVVARDGRLGTRPVAGGPNTRERSLGTYEEGSRFAGMVMGPRERKVVLADLSGRLTLVSLAEGAERRSLAMESPEPQCPPSFDASGSRLAWASSGRRVVSVWDLEGPPDAGPRELRTDLAIIKVVLFHPNGQWLAAAQGDAMRLWSVGSPWSRVLKGHESEVRRLRFSPDSNWLVSCGTTDGVSAWPLAPSERTSRRRLVDGVGRTDVLCYEMALDPGGRRALWGAAAVSLSALDGNEARWLVPRQSGYDVVFHAAAFDPQGRWIATAENYSRSPREKSFRIWDREMSELRHWPQTPPGEDGDGYAWGVYEMEVLADGDLLAAGQGGVRRVDPETGPVGWVWSLPAEEWARFAVGAGGRRLVGFRSVDRYPPSGPAFLLDLHGAAEPQPLAHRGNEVSAVALDPSGEILVTGDGQGTVSVGHVDGGEPHLLLGHEGLVTSVAVSPDGRWIASASGSEIRLWPMPDLTRPPLHALPLDALLEKLRSFTNLEAVEDPTARTGYRLELGPFPGWKDVPTW